MGRWYEWLASRSGCFTSKEIIPLNTRLGVTSSVRSVAQPVPILFSTLRATCPAPLTVLYLTTLIIYDKENKNHEAPRHAVFTSPLLLPSSQSHIHSTAPYSPTPSVYVLPLKSETRVHTHTKQQGKIYLYILILYIYLANWKTKDSAPNGSRHFLISCLEMVSIIRTFLQSKKKL